MGGRETKFRSSKTIIEPPSHSAHGCRSWLQGRTAHELRVGPTTTTGRPPPPPLSYRSLDEHIKYIRGRSTSPASGFVYRRRRPYCVRAACAPCAGPREYRLVLSCTFLYPFGISSCAPRIHTVVIMTIRLITPFHPLSLTLSLSVSRRTYTEIP